MIPYTRQDEVNIFVNEFTEKLSINRSIGRLLQNDIRLSDLMDASLDRAIGFERAVASDFNTIAPTGAKALPPGFVRELGADVKEMTKKPTTDDPVTERFSPNFRYVTPSVLDDTINESQNIDKRIFVDICHHGSMDSSEPATLDNRILHLAMGVLREAQEIGGIIPTEYSSPEKKDSYPVAMTPGTRMQVRYKAYQFFPYTRLYSRITIGSPGFAFARTIDVEGSTNLPPVPMYALREYIFDGKSGEVQSTHSTLIGRQIGRVNRR